MEPYLIEEVIAPGFCAMCASPNAPFIDLGIDYSEGVEDSHIGAILLCLPCFERTANMFGYFKKEEEVKEVDGHNIEEIVENAFNEFATYVSSNIPDDFIGNVVSNLKGSKETETFRFDDDSGQSTDTVINEEPFGVPSSTGSELFAE